MWVAAGLLPSSVNDMFDTIYAMKIHILVLDQVFDTGLSAFMDTLGIANELSQAQGLGGARFDVTLVGLRRRVHTSQGLRVPVQKVAAAQRPDVVLVPALGAKMPASLALALERPDVADASALLRDWSASGSLTGAACTSTFVLGDAGLLNGHRATTTWWLAPLFRQRFPKVLLDDSRLLVNSAGLVTAGAALAHLDLALWVVRQSSPELAALTARYLVVDSRGLQAAFVIPACLAHADPTVERFERWARARLSDGSRGFSLGEAAQAAGATERTLSRRLHAVMGKSPLAYFQDLRVERAVHLLQTSQASVEQIAARVGYEDGSTLRQLLRKRLGRGVKELRREP